MSIPFFLYRRLARWITCEFKLKNNSKIALENKYEIASFKDVFCHPFYWQVFQWVHEPPKLVVDCGTHCGHFSILADICFESKFGVSNTEYLLVEPNPYLLPIIQKNVLQASLAHRIELKQGLLGARSGEGTLWINHKNYLATGLHYCKGAKPFKVPYLDLLEIVENRTIDLMKIDIEGSEFEFIRLNLELLSQVNLIFMELHEAPQKKHQELFECLQSVGLYRATSSLEVKGQKLMIFRRQSV
jgi:FkbM family methyltransferase